jgi:carbon-monoxide dehydrogenase medium subunit
LEESVYPFVYYRPGSLSEAAALAVSQSGSKFMAGGMTLLPTLKQRLAMPAALIDLNSIGELFSIEESADTIAIGAMTRHADVAASELVRQRLPGLAELAGCIGDPAVRHRGTIGGSVANNDPAADYPAACLSLSATIITNQRAIAADDFLIGMFETPLREDELVTRIRFSVPSGSAYLKFRNPASRYATVGVFVTRTDSAVRVAVTGAGLNGVFRVREFEEALESNFCPEAVDGRLINSADLISDLHADADYRAHLIGVMARRAVERIRSQSVE